MNWPRRVVEEYKAFDENKACTNAHSLIELLFETKVPPCYFAGDLTKAKYGLLGLNPGYGDGIDIEYKAYIDYGWEQLYLNFFKIFHHELGLRSNYYDRFALLLAGILNKKPDISISERYTLLHENLVNFDLIPYHSKQFNLNMIEEKRDLIEPYVSTTKELIENSSVEYLFFNGKPWGQFLTGENGVLDVSFDEDGGFVLNPGKKVIVKAHFGNGLGRNIVWFDKFLTSPGSGISNQMLFDAGKRIRDYYNIVI